MWIAFRYEATFCFNNVYCMFLFGLAVDRLEWYNIYLVAYILKELICMTHVCVKSKCGGTLYPILLLCLNSRELFCLKCIVSIYRWMIFYFFFLFNWKKKFNVQFWINFHLNYSEQKCSVINNVPNNTDLFICYLHKKNWINLRYCITIDLICVWIFFKKKKSFHLSLNVIFYKHTSCKTNSKRKKT